jgi:hypothetical protein
MTGELKLITKIAAPARFGRCRRSLQLDGQFSLARATFTSYDVQGKIED